MSGLNHWQKADNPIHIGSMGAGQQSSDMYIRAQLGEIQPRPFAFIFADTGNERQRVYKQLWQLSEWAISNFDNPIPILICSNGNIYDDSLQSLEQQKTHWAGPNMYNSNSGAPIKKKCTGEYKIKPKETLIRELMKKHGFKSVIDWRGHTIDEVHRIKQDKRLYFNVRWPLAELRLRRGDCANHAEQITGINFTWSACKICPARCADIKSVREMKEESPEEWQEIVFFDNAARQLPGMKYETYLNRQLVPMGDMDLSLQSDNMPSIFDCNDDTCGL